MKLPRKFLHAEWVSSVCESTHGIAYICLKLHCMKKSLPFIHSYRSKMATPVLLNLQINRKCHFQINASYKSTSSVNTEKNIPEYEHLSSILITTKNSIWFIILLLMVCISWVWQEKWLCLTDVHYVFLKLQ